jgi:transposase
VQFARPHTKFLTLPRAATAVRSGSTRTQPSSSPRSRQRTTSRWSSCKRCTPSEARRSGSGRCGVFSTGIGSRAKKTAYATERDRPDILKRLEELFDGQLDLDPERLVFIDETWASTNMARRHGRCWRGERLRSGVPHGHWKTTTIIAGLRRTGMVAPMVLDGPIDREAFVAYVRQVLVPDLSPGDIVIMDNLSSHKTPAARDAIEAVGAKLLFLPPRPPPGQALQPRLQPDRAGILQAQGAPAQGCRAHHPRPLERYRPHPRPLPTTGVRQLRRQRRIRCRLIGNRSRRRLHLEDSVFPWVLIQGWRRSRLMSRRTLTDEQWERIARYLPGREGTRGRSGVDNRLFVDAILWMAGNAARWRDLPEVFGKWTGVHARFRRWSHAGVWERLFHSLADTPDFEYVLIDSTISKVHADASGAKGGLRLPRSAGPAVA